MRSFFLRVNQKKRKQLYLETAIRTPEYEQWL